MARAASRTSEMFSWTGWRVDDRTGQRVGTLAGVYEDAATGAPSWFLVRLNRFSTRYVLAPPAELTAWRGRIWLPYDRLLVERAPVLYTPPEDVSSEIEQELRRHYRLAAAGGPAAVRVTARRQIA
jgi:hypothetical protein